MDRPRRDASTPDSSEHLASRMRELGRVQHQFSVRVARLLGLGPTDIWALEHLFAEGPLGPAELGQRLGMTSPSATALVDRLEAAGHVERHPHPSDRRRLVITPTPHAGAAAYAVIAPLLHDLEEAGEELTATERAVVRRYLDRVITALASFAEAPGSRGEGKSRP